MDVGVGFGVSRYGFRSGCGIRSWCEYTSRLMCKSRFVDEEMGVFGVCVFLGVDIGMCVTI